MTSINEPTIPRGVKVAAAILSIAMIGVGLTALTIALALIATHSVVDAGSAVTVIVIGVALVFAGAATAAGAGLLDGALRRVVIYGLIPLTGFLVAFPLPGVLSLLFAS
ncbi:MAG: hypothetical protein J0J04_07775 [Microbacterium sp.]|uniref:hypothetical protein n=1 Tax=Microbacterium sp. TaxID=51671 RepID=UPI001AD58BA9|nr:hypothetical protein [Microbacterium sp.]MBN9214697.1 hypothetical protein [Microbacterium sp.]